MRVIAKLAGVSFDDAQENIKKWGLAEIGSFALVREPDNPHDPNAVRVEFVGDYLGYLPKGTAKNIAPIMDAGQELIALFIQRNESPFHETMGLIVAVVEC